MCRPSHIHHPHGYGGYAGRSEGGGVAKGQHRESAYIRSIVACVDYFVKNQPGRSIVHLKWQGMRRGSRLWRSNIQILFRASRCIIVDFNSISRANRPVGETMTTLTSNQMTWGTHGNADWKIVAGFFEFLNATTRFPHDESGVL